MGAFLHILHIFWHFSISSRHLPPLTKCILTRVEFQRPDRTNNTFFSLIEIQSINNVFASRQKSKSLFRFEENWPMKSNFCGLKVSVTSTCSQNDIFTSSTWCLQSKPDLRALLTPSRRTPPEAFNTWNQWRNLPWANFQSQCNKRGTTTLREKAQETWHSSRPGKNRRRGDMTEIQCQRTHTFIKIKKHSLGFARALERAILTFLILFLKYPGGHGEGRATKITLSLSHSFFVSVFLTLWLPLCLSSPFSSSQKHSIHTHLFTSVQFDAGSSSQTG